MTKLSPSANSNILEQSAFLEPYPKPPCVPSYPTLLLPTCASYKSTNSTKKNFHNHATVTSTQNPQKQQTCTKTYRDNLDLICGLRWAEMSAIMFNGFITSIEAIAASVAVPVSTTYLLCTFYWADNIAPITAPYYAQAFTTATYHSTHTYSEAHAVSASQNQLTN